MISLFLIGNFEVSSISFLLKKSLLHLTVKESINITDMMNKASDIIACSAYSYTLIFCNTLIRMNSKIATNINANNNLTDSDKNFFLKLPPLKNNLKSFKSRVFNSLHRF